MGTRVDVIGWGGDGMAIVNVLVEVVARHEDLWSVFRSSSEVSRLNDACCHDEHGGRGSAHRRRSSRRLITRLRDSFRFGHRCAGHSASPSATIPRRSS